jgi:hypothetical protein
MPEDQGRRLIQQCKQHLVETMRSFPECASTGAGARNADLEEAAGFALDLPEQNRWFTWSLLQSLQLEGSVEVLRHGKQGNRSYRLAR